MVLPSLLLLLLFIIVVIAGSVTVVAFATNDSTTVNNKVPPTSSRLLFSPSLGLRLPPLLFADDEKSDDCDTGAICVGPLHDHYPIGHIPGVLFTSRFVVPPLPKSHNSQTTTYYDYYNIFWRQQPKGGYMNQFVPQLMLGNVLANSTNYPDYDPKWPVLDSWHIGAQYFFAFPSTTSSSNSSTSNNNNDNDDDNHTLGWIAKAATGALIPVEPGEVIETSFTLVQVSNHKDWEWQLRIGVVGAHPSRWSLVVVRQPFMGMLNNNNDNNDNDDNNNTVVTWQDDIFQNVTVGSCLENYAMTSPANYPPSWQITMDVVVPPSTSNKYNNKNKNDHEKTRATQDEDRTVSQTQQSFQWDDWATGGGKKCPWMPQSTLASVQGDSWQRVTWNATLPPNNYNDHSLLVQMQSDEMT